jgi:hypothetical protein
MDDIDLQDMKEEVLIVKCKLCKESKMSDFSYYKESYITENKTRHNYCHHCKGHYWNNRWWTKKEWDNYTE